MDRTQFPCHTELVVWSWPAAASRCGRSPGRIGAGPPAEPDATRLVYPGPDTRRGPPAASAPARRDHLVADGHDLPAAGDCPMSMWRFLDDRRLLALGCVTEPFDNLLVRFDLDTRRVLSTSPSACRSSPSAWTWTGRAATLLAAAGKPNDQRPATAYLLRDDRPQRVPFAGDCWQADW